MQIQFENFDPTRFSFHEDPVLIVENFWSPEERRYFQDAMSEAVWKELRDMPALRESFPNCGNWMKSELGPLQAERFLDRLALPCIMDYIESFPNIIRRHMNFNYYSYGAGDCLLTHDDTMGGDTSVKPDSSAPLRRLALVTYLHEEWEPDWGGELILYDVVEASGARPRLSINRCIAPQPGSLVLFAVPRFHRVCRVDPVGAGHKRLSIAGWFMTEHAVPFSDQDRHRKDKAKIMSACR